MTVLVMVGIELGGRIVGREISETGSVDEEGQTVVDDE